MLLRSISDDDEITINISVAVSWTKNVCTHIGKNVFVRTKSTVKYSIMIYYTLAGTVIRDTDIILFQDDENQICCQETELVYLIRGFNKPLCEKRAVYRYAALAEK